MAISFGAIVESAVSLLLVVTIAYCILLNSRLKRLHADRGAMAEMIAELVDTTNRANVTVGGLKQMVDEANLALGARLEEAERFGIELANHVSAGQEVLERITRITTQASGRKAAPVEELAPVAAPVILPPVTEPMLAPVQNGLEAAIAQLLERRRLRDAA
jgi:hypothetical protein